MKKKVFFPNAAVNIFVIPLVFAFEVLFIVELIGLIWFDFPVYVLLTRPVQIIICFFVICVWTYETIAMLRNRIILDQTKIIVPEQWGKGIDKKQYRVDVDYADIAEIFLAETQKDSLNLNDCSALPMTYIVINCKNGDQKLININLYSKKRKKAILDEIILRARTYGNDFTTKTGEELYNEFIVERKREYKIMEEERKLKRAARRKKRK